MSKHITYYYLRNVESISHYYLTINSSVAKVMEDTQECTTSPMTFVYVGLAGEWRDVDFK